MICLKVISDILAHWFELINTFIITINFCNAMKMNCAMMVNNSNVMEENVLVTY